MTLAKEAPSRGPLRISRRALWPTCAQSDMKMSLSNLWAILPKFTSCMVVSASTELEVLEANVNKN